jgi:hypothetical protein
MPKNLKILTDSMEEEKEEFSKILKRTKSESTSSYLKATHQGRLKINNVEMPCFVLENGDRLISGRGLQRAFGIDNSRGGTVISNLIKNNSEVTTDDLKEKFNSRVPFVRKNAGGSAPLTYGYDATILVDICEFIAELDKSGRFNDKLGTTYKDMATNANILYRSFARTSVIALVDEATGYQGDRQKDELQKILSAYISKELLPWQKRFPNEYYEQIAKLRNWSFDPLSNKRPQIIGKITNQIVYELLPQGVLEELRRLNPPNDSGNRLHKFHQFLTLDIGNINLEKHLAQVIVLMRISKNWSDFEDKLYDAFPRYGFPEKLF